MLHKVWKSRKWVTIFIFGGQKKPFVIEELYFAKFLFFQFRVEMLTKHFFFLLIFFEVTLGESNFTFSLHLLEYLWEYTSTSLVLLFLFCNYPSLTSFKVTYFSSIFNVF